MSAPTDSWGLPEPIAPSRVAPKAPVRVVRDSWDDDSDDEPADHRQVWENANQQQRMPEIVLASGTTAPPPAALTGPLRILKRPTSTTTSGSSSPARPASSKPLQEREAEYAAARERIFGKNSSSSTASPARPAPSASSTSRSAASENPSSSQQITRQPRGPESAIGFGGRRPPPAAQPSAASVPHQAAVQPHFLSFDNNVTLESQRVAQALPDDDAPPPASG